MRRKPALVLLLPLALTGCQDSRDHPAELAVAKCSTPVQTRVHTERDLQQLLVTKLASDRRQVTGVVLDAAGSAHDFVCVVAPEATDKLRGLKVESLSVSEGSAP